MKLLQLHPKKKKGVKNAATTELGDENRIWTADEIGCLLNIMVTMLEEFSCITKFKKKSVRTGNQLPRMEKICN